MKVPITCFSLVSCYCWKTKLGLSNTIQMGSSSVCLHMCSCTEMGFRMSESISYCNGFFQRVARQQLCKHVAMCNNGSYISVANVKLVTRRPCGKHSFSTICQKKCFLCSLYRVYSESVFAAKEISGHESQGA
jgi:hypothetical protein